MGIVPQIWSDAVAESRARKVWKSGLDAHLKPLAALMALYSSADGQKSLSMKVWASGLDPHLKPLAALLALYTNADGHLSPIIDLTGQLGRSERYVRRCLAELRAQKILIADDTRFDEKALPARPDLDEIVPNQAGL